MENYFKEVQNNFNTQIKNVHRITEFDGDFLSLAISWLQDLEHKLKSTHGIENKSSLPTETIKLLVSLRENGPQRNKYEPIYSQSVVLLASYFASVLSDIFNHSLNIHLLNSERLPKNLSREEFKFSLQEMSVLKYDLSTEIGRIIARKSDLSFQDMKSISKAFKHFFDIDIQHDSNVSNIITAHACRHAIVHNGEITDHKCIKQVSYAENREIKKDLQINEKITFNKEEITIIGNSMEIYVKNACDLLLKKLNN